MSWTPAENTLGWEFGKMDGSNESNGMVATQLMGRVRCLPAAAAAATAGG